MKTRDEAVAEFRAELAALMRKWGADITASDHWKGYAECGEDVRMVASIQYDGEFGCRTDAEVDLRSRFDGDDA